MESWQSDLIEAANTLSLEATLHGEGLPGSFVSVALGDVELRNMDRDEYDEDRDSSAVYQGMELMVRPTNPRQLTTFILQAPADTFIHPHINIPYFCFGGNQESVISWTRNGDWLILLNNCRNLISQYWPGNAYQRWNEHRDGCRCIRRIAGLNGGTDWDCDGCGSRCEFCREGSSATIYYRLSANEFGDRIICENCANNASLDICPSCGDFTTSVGECVITGRPFCRSCGLRDGQGNYFHRDAFMRIAGTSYDTAPITEGAVCVGCNELVPNPESAYRSQCRRAKCVIDLAPIFVQLMEEYDGRSSSNGEEDGGEGDSAGFADNSSSEALDAAAARTADDYASGWENQASQPSLDL